MKSIFKEAVNWYEYTWSDGGRGGSRYMCFELEVNRFEGIIFTIAFKGAVKQQISTDCPQHVITQLGDDASITCDVSPFEKRVLFTFRYSEASLVSHSFSLSRSFQMNTRT